MESTQTTFCHVPYPVNAYCCQNVHRDILLNKIKDNISKIISTIKAKANNDKNININLILPKNIQNKLNCFFIFNFTIIISGPPNFVIDAKGLLLRMNPSQILKETGEMKLEVRKRFDEIMSLTSVQISIVPSNQQSKTSSGEDSNLFIEILGTSDNVDNARIHVLVLLDEMSGLYIETIELDIRLFGIFSGKKQENISKIMCDTQTNVYIPSIFQIETLSVPQLTDPNWNKDPNHQFSLFITGSSQNTKVAKHAIVQIANEKKNALISKHIVCLSRKIDWLRINHKDKLKSIMADNATTLILPQLGSSTNVFTVLGDNRVYIERTIRAVMVSICGFYVACIRRQPAVNGNGNGINQFHQQPTTSLDLNQSGVHINDIIEQISKFTGAEIIIQPQFIEVCGLEISVKKSFEQVMNTHFYKNSRDSKFQLELSLEHREFINGKKNGKINKIVKLSGSNVNFQENFNGYNMLIEIQNAIPSKALEGLTLLEDEMPAEISFFVPESFHKRIIGVGGKNIQRIMKKYGVYVKFSNADEFAQLGGYFENIDNVIARTPAKNKENLEQLRLHIVELIATGKDEKEIVVSIVIPRQLHSTVIGLKRQNLNKIESLTSTEITFSSRESGLDDVFIKGDDYQVEKAVSLLQELIPGVFELQIPFSSKAMKVIESDEFSTSIINKLKEELHVIDVFFYFPTKTNTSPILNQTDVHGVVIENTSNSVISVIFHFVEDVDDDGVMTLEAIKAVVTKFLAHNDVSLIQHKVISRAGLNAGAPPNGRDTFRHFDNKLLSSAIAGEGVANPLLSSYSLFDGGSFDLDSRNPKIAHSAPNLRSLFEEAVFPQNNQTQTSITPSTRAGVRSHLSESYDNVFSRGRADFNEEEEAVDSLDLLGATLAATSLNGISPTGTTPASTVVGGRNLLDHNSGRTNMEPSPFTNNFSPQPESMLKPSPEIVSSNNFWGPRSPVLDESSALTKTPNSNVRGLSLSKSLTDTIGIGSIKQQSRAPSKLRQEVETDNTSSNIQHGETKRWNTTPGTNPNAPSFRPSQTVANYAKVVSSNTIPKGSPGGYANAVASNLLKKVVGGNA